MKTTPRRFGVGLLVLLILVLAWAVPQRASAAPVRKAVVFNTAGTLNTDLCGDDFTTHGGSYPSVALRITVCLETTDSVLTVQVNQGGTAKLMKLNGGTALTAGNVYTFTVGASSTCTYNVQVATSTTVMYLLVEEVTGDVL